MPRHPVSLPPSVFPLPQETGRTLRWRLHQGLKAAILNGQFSPGERLPSSRALSVSFGVSRATVVEAFDQLAAEGFLRRRAGSGTYVSDHLGDLGGRRSPVTEAAGRGPSRRAASPRDQLRPPMPFTPCEPDVTQFPHQVWARLLARHARAGENGRGPQRLREALAAHLALSRGVRTDPERVIVVAGARQALHLTAHALLDPGDSVWFEEPGYRAARDVLTLAGARPASVPVDADGLDVTAGRRLEPEARAAYVTPSHQFPTGALMGLPRRLQLLAWAAEKNAWILEDDYDSEFSYDDRPLPALQGLDEHQSVVYLGTLNKVTYPGLRVGYGVVPATVAEAFDSMARTMSLSPPAVIQAALADFISEGHLARHINRMRALYKERQQLIVTELRRALPDHVSISPDPTGMHILAKLHRVSASEVALRGRTRGLDLRACSDSLILGYTHMEPGQLRAGVRELAGIVQGQVRIRAS